jgi:DNA-binding MarR family transcriptional regulator
MFEKDFTAVYNLVGNIIQAHKESLFSDQELSQLTIRQIHYLKCISKLTNPTLTQLACAFKITKPSVTAIIQHLSEMGYVEKHQSSKDLRVFTVNLTPKGARMARVDEEAIMEFCSQARSVLAEKEVEELEFLLARLLVSLK